MMERRLFFIVLKFTLLLIVSFSFVDLQRIALALELNGPFPIVTNVIDKNNNIVGAVKIYPNYVEGILGEDRDANPILLSKAFNVQGLGRIEIRKGQEILYTSFGFRVYDQKNEMIGSYYITPIYDYIYLPGGELAGKVKCLAWKRLCSAVASALLIGEKNQAP